MLDERALAIVLAIKGMEYARFSNLARVVPNSRTLALKLKRLEADGLVARSGGTYTLTEKGKKGAELLKSYKEVVKGGTQATNLDRIPHSTYAPLLRRYCELLYEGYGERLEGVVLFGSIAKGNWRRESDIDLLVVVQGWAGRKPWDRIEELTSFSAKLALSPEYSTALARGFFPAFQHVPLGPDELESFKTLYLDVAFDGIVLLDTRGLIAAFLRKTKEWAKSAGTSRVTLPDGTSYWIIKGTKLGEVVELGQQR